jgi:hypothetical protein
LRWWHSREKSRREEGDGGVTNGISPSKITSNEHKKG